MQYKKMHCKSLYMLILQGDILAAQEHLARHRDYGYEINPKIHSSPDRLLQLVFKKKHTSPSLTEIADFFTKSGIDIEAHEERALDLSDKNNYSMVQHNTLYKYMLKGNELAAKEFIKRCKYRGYNINARISSLKLSVLQIAVKRNLTPIAILLIDNGAEINLCDKLGITPLQDATINKNEMLIKKIVQRNHYSAYMNQAKNNSSSYFRYVHKPIATTPENPLDLTTNSAKK